MALMVFLPSKDQDACLLRCSQSVVYVFCGPVNMICFEMGRTRLGPMRSNEIQWDPMKKIEHRLFIKKTCTWQRTTKTRWKLHMTSSEWPSASYDTIHPYGFIPLCNMHQSYTHLYSPHIFCAPLIFHEIQLEMSHIKNYTKDQQRPWSCVPSFCSCNTNYIEDVFNGFSMDFFSAKPQSLTSWNAVGSPAIGPFCT